MHAPRLRIMWSMRVAITGGIAEGKSTVLAMLADAGWRTASADDLAREVMAEIAVQASLAEILGASPPVAPALLREAMARDPEMRRQVNSLTHPRIARAMLGSNANFIEVPLLIEACLQGSFESVIVVTCGPEEQLRRLTERLGDGQAARSMLAMQLPTRSKAPFSDDLIRTNQPLDIVRQLVNECVDRLRMAGL